MPETSPKSKIYTDYDLSKNSTLRIKAKADNLVIPKSTEELLEIFEWIKKNNLPWNILGAGSNLLLSSRAILGVTILTTALDTIVQHDDIFEVGAGVKMPRFCAYTAQRSYTGTEFMEGIPGTIGGGIVMNAGAHGSWISKILVSATVLDLETLELVVLPNLQREEPELPPSDSELADIHKTSALDFAYRHSNIDPKRHLVISAKFKLELGDKEEIRKRVLANNHHRSRAQPIKAWTCGCTFKNPSETCKAGLLIQEIGAKGWKEGAIQVSLLHGNFFENTKEGEGTSMDFCKLMARVQAAAKAAQGVPLEPEVQRIGEFTAEEDLIWA